MNSTPDPQPVLAWTDARGGRWSLHAGPQQVVLRSAGGQEVLIERASWNRRIDYNEVPGGVVFRFDLGDSQVGFLVGADQALRLLDSMQWSNSVAVSQAARLRTLEQRPRTWPTVGAWPMLALLGAILALRPGHLPAGLIIAGLTVLAIAVSLLQARRNPRFVHVPAVAGAAAVLLAISLTADVLAWLTPRSTPLSPQVAAAPVMSLENKVLAVVIVLLSLTVHEAAHAVVAWWCGDEGPRYAGRITLNPLAHIDPLGTILVPVVLAWWGQGIFGWARPVMVTLHGVPNPRRANLLISAAGPVSNLILSQMFLGLYCILGLVLRHAVPDAEIANFSSLSSDVHMDGFAGARAVSLLAMALRWGVIINIVLCCFNLIPLPPLDGGHVAGSLFPRSIGRLYARLGPYALLIFVALLQTSVFHRLMLPARLALDHWFGMVRDVTGW
jgi:Zn-dependent protease